MSADPNLIAFACKKCGKRLKAPAKLAGRSVRCPKCAESAQVPASSPPASAPPATKPAPAPSLDALQLNAPAIQDRGDRDLEAQEIRDQKQLEREIQRRRSQGKDRAGNLQPVSASKSTDEGTIPFDDDGDELQLAKDATESAPVAKQSVDVPGPSVFDDDLPDLESIPVTAPQPTTTSNPVSAPRAAHKSSDAANSAFEEDEFSLAPLEDIPTTAPSPTAGLPPSQPPADNFEDLIPDLDPVSDLPPLIEEEILQEEEYRVVCTTCGTPQYVRPSAKGMKIKCPDCYSKFKVPGPPKDWKKKQQQRQRQASQPASSGMELAPKANPAAEKRDETARKAKAQEMLEKAEGVIEKEESEDRYSLDFDHATFVQRTFGFLKDPLILVQIAGYAVVFGFLFGLYQYALNQGDTQFGKGLMLAVGILVPLVCILFALPMLSGGLALIEGVANKQRFVREIPAFNIFDNFADLLVILFAFGAAVVPGFIVGSILALNSDGAMHMRLIGMFGTTFLLFPIFLLSMMDNGSLFAPISSSVMSSLRAAAESWGSYYMKTLVAMGAVLIAWFMLLGGNEIMAGIAGMLLPLLVFFVCQQIGGLADAIGDHLSFEFIPTEREDREHDQLTIE